MQKRNRTSKNKKQSGRARINSHPPSRNLTPAMEHVFRFQATGTATQVSVTRGQLLNLIGVSDSLTALTADRILGAAKLRSISVWSPVIASFVPQTITVEWVGLNAPSSLVSDSSEGLKPAALRTSPPPDSSADWWSIIGQNESEVLMLISCPTASIIDLSMKYKLIDNEPKSTFTVATSSLTGAQVGYSRLDGSAGVLQASGGVSAF